MLNINYKRGKGQSIIDTAAFKLDGDKQLMLSIVDVHDMVDAEKIAGQNVRIAVKDCKFGDDELFVELGLKDGVDLIRILQRLFRQVANFEQVANNNEV